MKKNVELAGKSIIRKDLFFKHQKNAQELKIQLSLYCNQNESLNLLEISLNLKNIYLNNSIFPFNCRIPFLLSFSKEKEQIITQKDQEIQGLKNQLNAVYNSTSWKITKPLRNIKKITKLDKLD